MLMRGKRERVHIPEQIQPHHILAPQAPEHLTICESARQEADVVMFEDTAKFVRREITRGGGAMEMEHTRVRAVNARPAVLPRAHTQVQILDVSGLVHFVKTLERTQFC